MIAVILAGGRSSRILAIDKCLYSLMGKPLIEIIYRKLEATREFTDIYILASRINANHVVDLGLNVVVDNISAGPLIAVYQASRLFKEFFVTACDMPFISVESVKKLIAICMDSTHACIPRWGLTKYLEPLFAIYRRALIQLLEDCIRRGELSINKCMANQSSITYPDVECVFENPVKELFNVNTLEDLEKLKDLTMGPL